MGRVIAFLRGINVGGHRVTMEELRRVVAELGLAGVETFIASGNVIAEADTADHDELAGRLSAHLESRLGYAVAVFVRTPAELAAVAAVPAFDAAEVAVPGRGVHVGFLAERPSAGAEAAVAALCSAEDQLRTVGRELYWLRHGRFSDSPIQPKQLDRALAQPVTIRNLNTVRRLVDKFG